MQIYINSEDETNQLAQKIAKQLKVGDVITLNGNLGSGKTTFTRYLVNSLLPDEVVTSPTFNILNIYDYEPEIYHYDLYRIESRSEIEELGMEENIHETITIIEWSQLASRYIPKDAINIVIEYDGDKRIFNLENIDIDE